MGWISEFGVSLAGEYSSITSSLPSWSQQIINLFILTILIVIYAVFIWKFYRFIARKNVIELNLIQYNTSRHPLFSKIFSGILYVIEYLLILPAIVFVWFGVFAFFLLFMTKDMTVQSILIASATVVGAIRLISYLPHYGQTLAKEVAKLLPLTLLAVSMTSTGFFDFERILGQISQVGVFFSDVILYLLFIVFLELALRTLDIVLAASGFEDPDERETGDVKE